MKLPSQYRLLLQVGVVVPLIVAAKSVAYVPTQLAAIEPSTQVSYIVRIKQEQTSLRRTLIRVDAVRTTSFVSAGYLLADMITVLLCAGLIFINQDPFHESLLFTGIISCLLIFLSLLIRDLDNPFGYTEVSAGADVSLKPLQDSATRLRRAAGAP